MPSLKGLDLLAEIQSFQLPHPSSSFGVSGSSRRLMTKFSSGIRKWGNGRGVVTSVMKSLCYVITSITVSPKTRRPPPIRRLVYSFACKVNGVNEERALCVCVFVCVSILSGVNWSLV